MESNILRAIINIINNPIQNTNIFYKSKNRANNMGESLEEYIKDAFCNTFYKKDENQRNEIINSVFSYLGNQNNPPDCILRNGDAIEIKKLENKNSGLALNSSYPKSKLYSNSKMITNSCKNCEEWDVKDILYSVGVIKNNTISHLCMIYGIDYAADYTTYEKIKTVISQGILTIPDIEFSETNELGRVNRVDPLGITYLRIRGMWHIENPMKVFNYIYTPKETDFNFMALINNEKYYSFNENDITDLEKYKMNNIIDIKDVKIKDPNNPAILKDAKLITLTR